MFVIVECRADRSDDQTPSRFYLDGRVVEVEEVLDQWLGSDYRYFKLMGKDGSLYILRLDETRARWELAFFRSPRGETLPIYSNPEKRQDETH